LICGIISEECANGFGKLGGVGLECEMARIEEAECLHLEDRAWGHSTRLRVEGRVIREK